jgi:hypothetical protein
MTHVGFLEFGVFGNIRNSGMPDIFQFEVYMSLKEKAGGSGSVAGLASKVFAVSVPESDSLNSILPNDFFILGNDFNCLIISQ